LFDPTDKKNKFLEFSTQLDPTHVGYISDSALRIDICHIPSYRI